MFNAFEDMCMFYINCKGCPYEDCSSISECRGLYDKDKNTQISRLDLLVEVSEINLKLDTILKELLNNK